LRRVRLKLKIEKWIALHAPENENENLKIAKMNLKWIEKEKMKLKSKNIENWKLTWKKIENWQLGTEIEWKLGFYRGDRILGVFFKISALWRISWAAEWITLTSGTGSLAFRICLRYWIRICLRYWIFDVSNMPPGLDRDSLDPCEAAGSHKITELSKQARQGIRVVRTVCTVQ
jgi:hypothetical protein